MKDWHCVSASGDCIRIAEDRAIPMQSPFSHHQWQSFMPSIVVSLIRSKNGKTIRYLHKNHHVCTRFPAESSGIPPWASNRLGLAEQKKHKIRIRNALRGLAITPLHFLLSLTNLQERRTIRRRLSIPPHFCSANGNV
jgi:hypothetical protein